MLIIFFLSLPITPDYHHVSTLLSSLEQTPLTFLASLCTSSSSSSSSSSLTSSQPTHPPNLIQSFIPSRPDLSLPLLSSNPCLSLCWGFCFHPPSLPGLMLWWLNLEERWKRRRSKADNLVGYDGKSFFSLLDSPSI